jgi:copper chaperone CopZ
MKIDGVYDVKGDFLHQYITVTFDPEKTSVEKLVKALGETEFFVRGEPLIIK